MIDVALFSTGAKTIIGVKTSDGKINILPVDSLLIFQDPELVVERLLLTLEIQFGIQSTNQISKMYFAIPGTIKYDTGQIYRSFNFDKITLAKSYSGYSFKKSFGRIIKPENVYGRLFIAVLIVFTKSTPSQSSSHRIVAHSVCINLFHFSAEPAHPLFSSQ